MGANVLNISKQVLNKTNKKITGNEGQIGPGRVRSNCTGSENEFMFTLASVTLAEATEEYPATSSPSLKMGDYAVGNLFVT